MSAMTTTLLIPEPPAMELHVQRIVDVRMIDWPNQRLTSNDLKTSRWSTKDKIKTWRQVGFKTFRTAPPIPEGHIARVVLWCRNPKSHQLKDPSNLQPTAKALVDGITDAGVWPDDNAKYVIGQDCRAIQPAGALELVIQIWTAPRP